MSNIAKGPKRDSSHVLGEKAVNRFHAVRRDEWVVNSSQESDYGWDLLVTLEEAGIVTTNQFFVQVKGIETKDYYILSDTVISYPLKTTTLKFLRGRPDPAMLCVCDTTKQGQPVHWVWLNEVVPEWYTPNPGWCSQKTLKVRVPIDNEINETSLQDIEKYVKRFHSDRRIKESIGDSLLPALGTTHLGEEALRYEERPGGYVADHRGTLLRAGIIEPPRDDDGDEVVALSPEDQSRFQTIREAQNALKELRDSDAEEILEKIGSSVAESSSEYIKAVYYNCKGRLFQHKYEFQSAIENYELALRFREGASLYEADLLHAQFAKAWDNTDFESALPDNWLDRLEAALNKEPNECRSIRLKGAYIARTKTSEEAEQFLRDSVSWEREPKETLGYIAYLHSNAGQISRAERVFKEAEDLGFSLDALDWSMIGHVYLKKALRQDGETKNPPIYGAGPADVDITELSKAEDCFKRAYEYFGRRGFPVCSGETVVNYSVVLRLLGKIEEGERVCRAYLDQNPDDPEGNGALAGFLTLLDRAGEAIEPARKALEADPSSSLAFCNLLSCYCQAEEFDELVKIVAERQKRGFLSKEEEGTAIQLVVSALIEEGHYNEVAKQVEHLEADEHLGRFAALARVLFRSRTEAEKTKVHQEFRDALQKYPKDLNLLTHFVSELMPVNEDTADEIADCLESIRTQRQLAPHEYQLLGKAHLLKDDLEQAEQIMNEATARFPEYPELIGEQINVQMAIGDEEKAYSLLMALAKKESSNRSILWNLATIAANTGRLDEAIKFFERTLRKAKSIEEAGIIYNHLFNLRLKRGDDPEIILRHVVQFGRTVTSDDDEATYLIMFMLAPKPETLSSEIETWREDFRARLEKFTTQHPDFPVLRSIKIPENVPEEEKGSHFRAELSALLLPNELAAAPFWQSARVKPWPLVLRIRYAINESVFGYWSRCIESDDFEHSIHVFGDCNNLTQESESAEHRDRVCLDITALLTLAELDLLDILADYFGLIVIASGTRHSIWMESSSPIQQHPLAVKIADWMVSHRHKIRTRDGRTTSRGSAAINPYVEGPAGIQLDRKDWPLDIVLSEGVGESLILAKRLGIPLYCDESAVRQWATEDHGIESFSTLALVNSLVKEGHWNVDQETKLIVELMKRNYRWIPFDSKHLNSRLRHLISVTKAGRIPLTSISLRSDEVLGALMLWFGDTKVTEEGRLLKALDWWLSILESDFFERSLLVACMEYPVHCHITASTGSVLLGRISKFEMEEKASSLLASFLWKAYTTVERRTEEVWFSIKGCVEHVFVDDPNRRHSVLFAFIPKWLLRAADTDRSLDGDKKTGYLYDLTSRLPDGDRQAFENSVVKEIPKLRQV